MAKNLWNGRKFNLLNVVDDFNCEVLQIEADIYLPIVRLIHDLKALKQTKVLPKMT
jgi:putative transposase